MKSLLLGRFQRWLCHHVARGPTASRWRLAVECCTGWRYVVEEITATGYEAHMAEPADTQAERRRKRHAMTDRSDARLLRTACRTTGSHTLRTERRDRTTKLRPFEYAPNGISLLRLGIR